MARAEATAAASGAASQPEADERTMDKAAVERLQEVLG